MVNAPGKNDAGLRVHFQLKETIVTIGADSMQIIEAAIASIREQRDMLEDYIRSDPFFRITLDPYTIPASAPVIAHRMAEAGSAAGIGPMGAVAGTIAAIAVEVMADAGATFAFVDNGGDIALITDRPLLLGVYAGESPINDLALEIQPGDSILGICTSSGTVGPSISFGNADAALVVSADASLADAAATALGNAVTDENGLENVFDAVRHIKGILGALVIKNDRFAAWGNLPRLVRAKLKPELITRG